ncbi:MAG: ABC transporter substrate-binding protein [Oscillospiraceae bacterium]|nr:ABC transporter substrate-binding protein [Oscillospiraceae bacterium]
MNSTKRFLALLLALCLMLALTACGQKAAEPAPATAAAAPAAAEAPAATAAEPAPAAEPKWLNMAVNFAYPSLDAHKDYYGWYTQIYGVTETLYRIDSDMSVSPLLAKDYSVSDDGLTWTFVLADAVFSNGNPVTADMVARNFQRLVEVNERYSDWADYIFEAKDEKTLAITTPDVFPTMLVALTDPEFAIMDLDATTDFDNAPIASGPFVIRSFKPEGDVEVVRNDNYWNGKARLDGATLFYLPDADSKLLAMQSGEIDCYTSVDAAAKEIYEADPASYNLTVIPGTRMQFYVINKSRLSDNVCAAINLTVDCEAIAAYLKGTTSAAVGPFVASAPYGQVTKPAPDPAAAKALLEADGYALNGDGFYEKGGKVLELNIAHYKSRQLPDLAVLMQEQFKNIGVKAILTVQEDPDAGYVATGDYDIALYCMIADTGGDPYYCVDALYRQSCKWAKAGFPTDETEALINKLQFETDIDQRAALANQIVQKSIDENAFGYVGLFNKVSVARPGVTGFSENIPFDFYGLTADTDIA